MPTTSGRILALLSLLQARRDWPGNVLAERLGVSIRTVRRDVDRLRELGYRVTALKGPDGGYRLEAGEDLPPLLFDDDQAVALAVALHLVAAGRAGLAAELGEAALRALSTVRQVMPSRVRRRLDTLPITTVDVPGSISPTVDREVLDALGAAVHSREVLRFGYVDAETGAEGDARRVEPHHLVIHGQRWYVVAWDLDHEAWRTFRADRMRPRVPTGPRFADRQLPDGVDVTTFVVGRFRGASAGLDWPCRAEAVVSLPIADVRPYVADGLAEPVGPDRTRVRIGAWSWPALAAELCRFDAEVEVVDPPELVEAFDLLARRCQRTAHPPT